MKRIVLLAVFALLGFAASAQVAKTNNDVPLQKDSESISVDMDVDDYVSPDVEYKSQDVPIPPPLFIYPNPTANKVVVGTESQVVRIDVRNTRGNTVLTVHNEKSAELLDLPAGSYIFTVTLDDGSTYTYTVIKR